MIPTEGPPYPGLRSFERNESELFFGRDGCIETMIARLNKTRFLAVLGSSGTGKSSLVKAGLLPALGKASNDRHWRIVQFRPGSNPLGRLAEGLLNSESAETACAKPSDQAINDLATQFKNGGPLELIKWCRDGHRLPAGTDLLLLVDQFEELFRFSSHDGREQAYALVSLLLESRWPRGAADPQAATVPIYVIITMRSEYLGACALLPGLAEAINEGTYLTPRMTRDQCEEAIVGPALLCGVDVKQPLVTRLLNDMADFAPWEEQREGKEQLSRLARQADQLPLMQYALNQMWRRASKAHGNDAKAAKENNGRAKADGRIELQLADYFGLEAEIDQSGERVFKTLSAAEQAAAKKIFRAVTSGTTPADAVRRPTAYGDLVKICGKGNADAVRAVVKAFGSADCQFLTPDAAKIGPVSLAKQWIDISHESLIRQWGKLSQWVRDEYQSAETYRDIERSAKQWKSNAGNLLTKLDLANARNWYKTENPSPAWAERYGDAFSLVEKFIEKSRRTQFFHRLTAAVFILAAVSILPVFLAFTAVHLGAALPYIDPAGEFTDFNVLPQAFLRNAPPNWYTPRSIPGGYVISTLDLQAALKTGTIAGAPFKLIDVLQNSPTTGLPSSAKIPVIFYPDAGQTGTQDSPGSFQDGIEANFATFLSSQTQNKLDTPLVFFCDGSQCWESYNASLRAIYLGYSNVYWYRGGIQAWEEIISTQKSGLDLKSVDLPKLHVSWSDLITTGGLSTANSVYHYVILPMLGIDYEPADQSEPTLSASEYVSRGVAEVGKKDYSDAINDFTMAIEIDAKNSNAYYNRGLAYADEEQDSWTNKKYADAKTQDSEAIVDYTKAIVLDASNAGAYYHRGLAYAVDESYADAIFDFTKVITLDSKNADAYYNRGLAYSNVKDYKDAIGDFTNALSNGAQNTAVIYHKRGLAYYGDNQSKEAVADYTQSIQLNPSDASVWNDRGLDYYWLDDDYTNAVSDFLHAISLNGNSASYYTNLGLAYDAQQNYDGAINSFEKAVQLNPKADLAYYGYGRADAHKGEYDDAIQQYNKAIALNSSEAYYFDGRGDAYRASEKYDTAIRDYNTAISIEPNASNSFYDPFAGRGRAYLAEKKYDKAALDFAKALSLRPIAVTYWMRGIADLYWEKPGSAADDLVEAVQHSSYPYYAIWLHVARLRAGENDASELAANVKKIDQTKWPWPVVALFLGSTTPDAVLSAAQTAPDAATKDDQVCEANFYTGVFQAVGGAQDQAKQLFQTAASSCPHHNLEYQAASAELARLH